MITEADLRSMIETSQRTNTVTDDLASALQSIAEGIGMLKNFAGYTQLDDMISDAVLVMLKAVPNVDLTRTSNPFSYMSRICFNSFRTSIKSNRKHYLEQLPRHASVGHPADTGVDDEQMPFPVQKLGKLQDGATVDSGTINLYRSREGKVVAVMTYDTLWDLWRNR